MDLITKIRTAAFMQASLRAFFGEDFETFRWYDQQLKQGALAVGPCVLVTGVSQYTKYLHPGPNPLTEERVQYDVLALDPAVANAAADAICAWLNSGAANFIKNGMFASPAVNAPGPSNFRLNRRSRLWPTTNRPVPWTMLDYRMLDVAI